MLAPAPAALGRRRAAWPSRLLWAVLGGLVGAAVTLLCGVIDRTPANPHAPTAFSSPPLRRTAALDASPGAPLAKPHDGFRLVTWNIHHGTGADGVRDPARTAAALRASRFDVAVLQEVDGPAAGAGGQAADLAGELRAAGVFVGTETRWGRVHRGNAVLTRLPAGPLHRVPLPDTRGKGFRTATVTTVRTPAGTPVRIVGVHLSRGDDRAAQLAAAADLFLSLEAPCVLAGDFNTKSADSLLRELRESPGGADALAALPGDRWEVEQVFIRGLLSARPRRTPAPASDHPLISVDLRVPRGGPPCD